MADPRLESGIHANAQWFYTDKYSLIDQASATVVYYGFPVLDADGTDPVCAVAKLETTGNVTTVKWANGSERKNVLWSTRAVKSYDYLKST